MKVALVLPPLNLEKAVGKFKKFSSPSLHLGIAYLASYLSYKNIPVDIIDSYSFGYSIEHTVELIKTGGYDYVGLSCVTPGSPIAHVLTKKIKEVCQNIKVIFGGVHPTLMPNEVLQDRNIDYLVLYEGEEAFYELLMAVENNTPKEEIEGIAFVHDENVIITPKREFIKNLDALPMPVWEKFELSIYHPLPHWVLTDHKAPLFPILGTRGCPFQCTYCSVQTVGKINRRRSPESICDELERLIQDFRATQVIFWDATFPLNKQHGILIFEEMIRRGLHKKIFWECETRVDVIDEELLKLMKRAGCKRIFYGIESGNQDLLDAIKKGYTLAQVEKTVRLTQKVGIEIMASFMLGLPGETMEKSQRTLDYAIKLNPDYAKFNLTIPYPGTVMYEQELKKNTIKSFDWGNYTSLNALDTLEPVYVPDTMTKEELISTQKKAIRKFYMRPRLISKHLKNLKSFDDIKRYFEIFHAVLKSTVGK